MLEVAVSRHLSVTWTWVKDHAGQALNERVDEIASGEARLVQFTGYATALSVVLTERLPSEKARG